MTRITLCASLTLSLLLLSPGVALAQKEEFFGTFTLEGRYSNQRKTSVLLQIRSDRVSRSSKYTSGSWAGRDGGDWSATRSDMEWRQEEKLLVVTYRFEPAQTRTREGLIDNLSLADADVSEVLTALGEERRTPARELRAAYFFRANGEMMEVISHRNKQDGDGPEWAFTWIKAQGPQVGGGQTNPGSSAFTRKAKAVIAEDWAEFTEDRYVDYTRSREDQEDLSDADFEEIYAEEAVWTDLNTAWVSFDGDEVRSDAIDDLYAAGNPYKDAAGADVPRDAIEIWHVRFKFELGGWEHYATKTYVFNRADGTLLDQDEEFEEEAS